MGTITRSHPFVDQEVPTVAEWNVDTNQLFTLVGGQLDKANVDSSSSDGIMTMDEAQTITGAKTWSAAAQFNNTVTVGVDDTGKDVKFFGATASSHLLWDESLDTLKLVGGAKTNLQGTLTVGVDNTGYDVQLFGATAGAHLLWDESADTLKLVGGAKTNLQGTLTVGVDDTGNDVKFFGATAGVHLLWDESLDTLKLVGGAKANLQGTLTVGVNDTGYDVQLFGATSGAYMLWDESVDDLLLVGGARLLIGETVAVSTSRELEVKGISSSSGDIALIDGADDANYVVVMADAAHALMWDASSDMRFATIGNIAGGTFVERFRMAGDGGFFAYSLGAETSGTDLHINATTKEIFSVTSSAEYKENVRTLEVDTSSIYNLALKTFEWAENSGSAGLTDFGLIAEEVYVVEPALVNMRKDRVEKEGLNPESGNVEVLFEEVGLDKPYSIRNPILTMMMLAELQKLANRVEALGG